MMMSSVSKQIGCGRSNVAWSRYVFAFTLVYGYILKQSHGQLQFENSLDNYDKDPVFITQSGVYKFVIGEIISLPCEVRDPGAYVLAWKRGIAILTAGNVKVSPDHRVQLTNGYTLIIRDAREHDAGDYTCQIATIEPREITHHVEILIPPRIHHVTSGGHLQVKKGSPVRLECSASGNPTPTITWTRKNNVLPNGEDKLISPTYVIEKMDRHKGGIYICTANNGVGHIATSQINLHVLFPPEVSVEKPILFSGDGEEVTLTCIVHGEAPPEVSWYKDTLLIPQTERVTTEARGIKHSLIIRGILFPDYGNYTCVATNLLGKDRKIITLTGCPGVATFQSPSISQWCDKYNISWIVKSFSPIEEYKLFYRAVQGQSIFDSGKNIHGTQYMQSSHFQLQNIYNWEFSPTSMEQQFNWIDISILATTVHFNRPIQSMNYVLRNLDPKQQYQVKLKSKNRYGWSDLSEPFLFSTSSSDADYRDLSVTYYSNKSSEQLPQKISGWSVCLLLLLCIVVTM